MRAEYTRQATSDVRKILAESKRKFGDLVATQLDASIRRIVEQIVRYPESRPRLPARPGVRVAVLDGYPYKIFYRALKAELE